MVRLVFRPYTQIWRSICTSEPLRASIRVSSDFTLFRHSSPSFGSQQIRSYSDLSKESRPVDGAPEGSHLHSLSFRARVCHPNTRVCVGLLGPCFKTGRLKPFRQHPKLRVVLYRASKNNCSQQVVYKRAVEGGKFPKAELQSSVQSRAWPTAITQKLPSAGF